MINARAFVPEGHFSAAGDADGAGGPRKGPLLMRVRGGAPRSAAFCPMWARAPQSIREMHGVNHREASAMHPQFSAIMADTRREDLRLAAQRSRGTRGPATTARDSYPRSGDTSYMPSRLTSSHFVGRVGELAELELAVREASAGRPTLVLLGGDSGVGKTRLVGELEHRLSAGRDDRPADPARRRRRAGRRRAALRPAAQCPATRWCASVIRPCRMSAPAAAISWRRSFPAWRSRARPMRPGAPTTSFGCSRPCWS